MVALKGTFHAYAPAEDQTDKSQAISGEVVQTLKLPAKPVRGSVNMSDLRRQMMERHAVVRAYLAR